MSDLQTRAQHGPAPSETHPMDGYRQVGFLKPLVNQPNVEIGEYTYYDDPEQKPEQFYERCVRYHHEFLGDRLIIGRFCAIAAGAQFIMNGANHRLDGLSTYPFAIFGKGWQDRDDNWKLGLRGDTRIGNDVWIGTDAVIMPGVAIGDGAIIGSRAVVASDVPAYGIAVGNPARTIKRRFDDETIERLLAVSWWNWPADRITASLEAIRGANIAALERASN